MDEYELMEKNAVYEAQEAIDERAKALEEEVKAGKKLAADEDKFREQLLKDEEKRR